jgi:outer membrane protein TolC
MQEMEQELRYAEIELKSMLSYPLDTPLELTSGKNKIDQDVKRLLKENARNQEWTALKESPEMREEILKRNITLEETRREILQSFPGLSIFASNEYDSNEFLVDPSWSSFSVKLLQSLTNLATLPVRYEAAKGREELADARRKALSAAIIAQIHIGRARLESAQRILSTATLNQRAATEKSKAARAKADEGLVSPATQLTASLDYHIESLRAIIADIERRDAYASLKLALGENLTGDPLQISKRESVTE